METKYPPYVNAYGIISKLFDAIKVAAVPPKFTTDFIYSVLGLKSTSYRAMVPLLKNLALIDQANVPTNLYKDLRDERKSKIVLASCVKKMYEVLYKSNEYVHKLSKDELINLLTTVTGEKKGDKTIASVAGTFMELVKLSDFELSEVAVLANNEEGVEGNESDLSTIPVSIKKNASARLGISYTINLNLPPTTEIEVFNAIFKSLKNNILDNLE